MLRSFPLSTSGPKKIAMEDLLGYEQLFIVGEPGYGKSTLIRGFKAFLDQSGKHCVLHEGANFDRLNVEAGTEYILFDALDENPNIIPVFNELVTYCTQNNIRLVISNRNHYLSLISHLLSNQHFNFIELLAFEDEQIFEFLTLTLSDHGYAENDIRDILRKSKANSQRSILRVPRYLDGLCTYIIHDDVIPEKLTALTRAQLFDKVVYFKLDSENLKREANDSNYKLLTKRVLERLSLTLEMQQLNVFSKEDFVTFLDQADSNISLIFLNNIDLDDLLQRVLQSEGEVLRFEHTEFQEFLAAKELVRLGNRFQTIDDLMIDHDLRILPPNWIDVLNFAIDLDIAFIAPLLAFIKNKHYQLIDEKLISIILTADPALMDERLSAQVFDTCFNYYTHAGYSAMRVYTQLACFFRVSNADFLNPLYAINDITPTVSHIVNNQILIIEALAKKAYLAEPVVREWINYLIKLVVKDDANMASTIFYALTALKAGPEVLALLPVFEKKADYLLNNYLYAVSNLNPNATKVINLIVRSLVKKRRLNQLDQALGNVSLVAGLRKILATFKSNPALLKLDQSYSDSEFYQFFENIAALNSIMLDKLLRELVELTFKSNRYGSYTSKILIRALEYSIKKDPQFLLALLPYRDFLMTMDELAIHFTAFLSLDLFQQLEVAMLTNARWRLPSLLHKTRAALKLDVQNPIVLYLDEKYPINAQANAKMLIIPPEPSKIEKLREYFLFGSTQFFTNLVPMLVKDFAELNPLLTDEERAYLTKLISDVLQHYDPEQFSMEIQEYTATTTTFSHNHDVWFQIELYFKAAYLLEQNDLLLLYRDKFLKSLPRMDVYSIVDGELLKSMLKVIAPLSQADLQTLFNFCVSRTDDLLLMSVRSFAESIRFLKLKSFKPLLMDFVRNDKVKSFEQEEALQVFGELADSADDRQMLQQLFDDSITSPERPVLASLANGYLVRAFNDTKAIDWRFEELRKRLKPFDPEIRYSGGRKVSSYESEMDRPEFPKFFYGLNGPYVKQKMLELLTYSFSIRTDHLHFTYSNYLQQIIHDFYKAIINLKDLNAIIMTVESYPEANHTYSFAILLHQLQMELYRLNFRSEPFLTAVHRYNRILGASYLPINSSLELKETIAEILNHEISNLIENEGFYRVAQQASGKKIKQQKVLNEELIQKTLKIALENVMLTKGFRKTDIYREVQSYDDLKYDYLVNYGLHGPVLIELKLLHNREIQDSAERAAYLPKLEKYLMANKNQGIYAVFQTRDKPADTTAYHDMVKEYAGVEGLEFSLIKCI